MSPRIEPPPYELEGSMERTARVEGNQGGIEEEEVEEEVSAEGSQEDIDETG